MVDDASSGIVSYLDKSFSIDTDDEDYIGTEKPYKIVVELSNWPQSSNPTAP